MLRNQRIKPPKCLTKGYYTKRDHKEGFRGEFKTYVFKGIPVGLIPLEVNPHFETLTHAGLMSHSL